MVTLCNKIVRSRNLSSIPGLRLGLDGTTGGELEARRLSYLLPCSDARAGRSTADRYCFSITLRFLITALVQRSTLWYDNMYRRPSLA